MLSKNNAFFFFATLFVFLCVTVGEGVAGQNLPPKLPDDVADYLEREASCEHFRGEFPYDDERKAFLEKTMSDLRCQDLSFDRSILSKKYICQSYASADCSAVELNKLSQKSKG